MTKDIWSQRFGWAELRQEGGLTLAPDEAARTRIARFLEIKVLEMLSATLQHRAWMDGVEIEGRLSAIATRLCGVSLEPFDERVDTSFTFRFVPEGSVHAPAPEIDIVIDLEAADPPEVVNGDAIDLASHVVETLALALEPFPRKPDAVFDYTDPLPSVSPFAVLKFGKTADRD